MVETFNRRSIDLFNLCSIIVILATVMGTIGQYLGIKWNVWFVLAILGAAFFIHGKIRHSFESLSTKNTFVFWGVLLITLIIYSQYSPNLEIRQDPSLYTFRTMNLLNYGTTSKESPILERLINEGVLDEKDYEGYATILNGTSYKNGRIDVDFYSGGSYVNALIGVLNKDFNFFGNSVIAILISLTLYLLMMQFEFFKNNAYVSGAISLIYMISPINTWFFRGSYSEGIACFIFLFLIYLWEVENKKQDNVWLRIVILIATLAALTIRIDYIIILAVNIFIMTYRSPKWGVSTAILGILMNRILMNIYTIYYNRISADDMPLIKYCNIIVIFVLVVSLSFYFFKSKLSVEQILDNKYINKIIIVVSIVLIALIFRNDLIRPENYEVQMIHEKLIRTYNEEIFDRLFLVVPNFILILGIIMLYYLFRDKKISLGARLFMMGIFMPYCYYFYSAGNSPQLYWNIRRYTYILIPTLFIGFIYFVSKLKSKETFALILVGGISVLNLQLDARQIVEFKGLHESVKMIEENYLVEDNLVLYEPELKYVLSSLISYSDNEFIPIGKIGHIEKVIEFIQEPIIYVSQQPINEGSEPVHIQYTRLGENYDELPKDIQNKEYLIYITQLNSSNEIGNQKNIYPNTYNKIVGIYEDGWTDGEATITINIDNEKIKDKLIIERKGYDNPLDEKNELNLVVRINDTVLKEISYEGQNIVINVPSSINTIEKVEIFTNTFIPKEENMTGDERSLGIDIEKIYLNNN